MATDSGTETLHSDGSPCDLMDEEDSGGKFAPPNIQPFSGVLETDKIVIRPIAFKPARFGLAGERTGERYGSTPVLTRPGSRFTLYGSTNDLQQLSVKASYSLDRKLRSSCPSASSSPHKLINYDSLESVRKSPVSNADSGNKTSYRLSSAGGGSSLDLTPSPSDSGVSELEAALRDRDSELAYLRQTMEHNEQVIFRVYQEKEKVWERELRRLKGLHESRLRASAEKTLKLEQLLMMQTYQLHLEKKRLRNDAERANCQSDRLQQEMDALKSRLESTEWGLCQKTGEISLLKSQLKDCQNEQTSRFQELLQLRSDHRDLQERLAQRDTEIAQIRLESMEKHEEALQLREQFSKLRRSPPPEFLSGSQSLDTGLQKCQNRLFTLNRCTEMERLRREFAMKCRDFQNERLVWAQEKEKVLRYQKQLQVNYIEMYRRTRTLEAEVQVLTAELGMIDKSGMKKIPTSVDLTKTLEL